MSLFLLRSPHKGHKQVKEVKLEEEWKVKQYDSPKKVGRNFDHIGLTPDALAYA